MKKTGLILVVQSILCVLLALLLIAAVIGIYRDGAAARAEDPLARIFTPELAAERLRPIAPLFFAVLGLTAVGLILRIKAEKGLGPVQGGRPDNRARGGKIVRTVLLIAAIVLIIAGLFNAGARDVFSKAVRICTECVGLG